MNPEIEKLHLIAAKPSRLIIGLMSGTSLDGLDIALCRISNQGEKTEAKLLQFESHSYNQMVKSQIQGVFAKYSGYFQQLTLLNAWLGRIHAEMILESLAKWKIAPQEVDVVASHGQTVFHAPQRLHKHNEFPNATFQISDGDHIAYLTGILTISDFRQKHVAAGGEGAPLSAYGDYLLFRSETENRILLNIGGIANFTYLPKSNSNNGRSIFVTDTGPGNTLMDEAMQYFYQLPFDKNGEIASQGKVDPTLLNTLKSQPFFKQKSPKTTGQETFNFLMLKRIMEKDHYSKEDWMATLTQLTADAIAAQIENNCAHDSVIYTSGGGSFNGFLMQILAQKLPQFKFKKVEQLGIQAAAKEAVLFAVLANQTLAGKPIQLEQLPAVNFGKISFPV